MFRGGGGGGVRGADSRHMNKERVYDTNCHGADTMKDEQGAVKACSMGKDLRLVCGVNSK